MNVFIFDYSALVPFFFLNGEVASYIIQRFYVIISGSGMVGVELGVKNVQ